MELHGLIDIDKLNQYIYDGYIRKKVHPHLPLTVLNYTDKTRQEAKWDEITKLCRGIVVDTTGHIVIHCLSKITDFNNMPTTFDLSGPTHITEKIDGKLGLIGFYEDQYLMVTSKGFQDKLTIFSEKELKAFEILCHNNVTAAIQILPKYTVLLGVITDYTYLDNKQLWVPADGIYSWPGRTVQKLDITLRQAMNYDKDVIVYFENTGERLRILKECK